MRRRLTRAAGDTFRSISVRNFRLFFVGQLISQTGTWLTMVTQTLLVLELTGSGVAIGVLAAAMFGPLLVLGPWGGSLADRVDKRRLLLRTQSAAMIQSLVLAAVVFTGVASVPVIYALALVQGVLFALDTPARRAFVAEMVPPEMVPNAVSLNSAIMTAARVVGPAMAGALVLTVGFGWAFLLDGLSYGAVIYGLWAMRTTELHPSTPAPQGPQMVRDGLRYVRARPDLLVPMLMLAVIGTLAFNFQVTIPLLVTGPLGGGTGTFTLLFSVLSVGSLVGALGTARRTEVTNHHIVMAAGGFGLAMVGLAVAPGLWAAFPVAVVVGLTSVAFLTASTAVVQLRAAPEYRGRVLALQSMVFLGSTPIGGPLLGLVSDVLGPRVGVMIGAMACLGAAAWGHRALDRARASTRRDDPASTDPAIALAD